MVFDALFGPSKETPKKFFFDGDVEKELRSLIKEARQEIILVSPYNDFWLHLKEELRDALRGGVDVLLLYRARENEKEIKWLEEEGATVLPVERLHSKLYMNETTAFVTSMNLVESSALNSKEICARFDGPEREELLEYVRKLAGRSEAHVAQQTSRGASRRQARPKDAPRPRNTPKAVAHVPNKTGYCIRCGDTGIRYNPDEPLCSGCLKRWKQYENRDYPEKHCHRCGKEQKTSFGMPLCTPCYKKPARVK